MTAPSKPHADLPYQPSSSFRFNRTVSVADLNNDLLTPIANKYWPSPTHYQNFSQTDISSMIDTIYYTELINADVSNPALGVLDLSSYLEYFLWPTFDPNSSTYPHIMSILLLINTKLDSLPHLNIWEQLVSQPIPSRLSPLSNHQSTPTSSSPAIIVDAESTSTTTNIDGKLTDSLNHPKKETVKTVMEIISNDKKLQGLLKITPLLEHVFPNTPSYLTITPPQEDPTSFLTILTTSRPLPAPFGIPLRSLKPLHKSILPQEHLTILTFLHYAFRALEHPIVRGSLLPFISIPMLRWISPQFVSFGQPIIFSDNDSPSFIVNDGRIVYENNFHQLVEDLNMKTTFNKINDKIFTSSSPSQALASDRFIGETVVIPHLLLQTINSIKYLGSQEVLKTGQPISDKSSTSMLSDTINFDRDIASLLDLAQDQGQDQDHSSDSSISDSSDSDSDSDSESENQSEVKTNTDTLSTAPQSATEVKKTLSKGNDMKFLDSFIDLKTNSVMSKLLSDSIYRGFTERVNRRTRYIPTPSPPLDATNYKSQPKDHKSQRKGPTSKQYSTQKQFSTSKTSFLQQNTLLQPSLTTTTQQDIQYLQQCLYLHRTTIRKSSLSNFALLFHRTLLHSVERTLLLFTDLLSNVDCRKLIRPLITTFHLVEQCLFLPFLSALIPSIEESIRLPRSNLSPNCANDDDDETSTQLSNSNLLRSTASTTQTNLLLNPHYDLRSTFQFNLGGMNLIISKLEQAKALMLSLDHHLNNKDSIPNQQFSPTSIPYLFTIATPTQLNTLRELLSNWLITQYFSQTNVNPLFKHQITRELPPFQTYQILSRITYYLNFNVQLTSPEPRSHFSLIAEYEEKLKRVQIAIRQVLTPTGSTPTISLNLGALVEPQNEIFFAPTDPTAVVTNTSPELISLKRLLVSAKLPIDALESIIRSLGLFLFHPTSINMSEFYNSAQQHNNNNNDNEVMDDQDNNTPNFYYAYLSYLLVTYLTPPPNINETTKDLPIYPTSYPIDSAGPLSSLGSQDSLQRFVSASISSPLPSAQLQYLTLHDLLFTAYYLQRQEVAFGLIQHIYSTVFHGLRPVLRFTKEFKAVNDAQIGLKDLFKLDATIITQLSPTSPTSSSFSSRSIPSKSITTSTTESKSAPTSSSIGYSIDFIRNIPKALDLTRFDNKHDHCYVLPRDVDQKPLSVQRNHGARTLTGKIVINFSNMSQKQFEQWASISTGSILYLACVVGTPSSPSLDQSIACPNLVMLRGCEVINVLDAQGVTIPLQVLLDSISDPALFKSLRSTTKTRTIVIKLDYNQHEQDIKWISSNKPSIPPHLFTTSEHKLTEFGRTPLLPGTDHYFGISMIPISAQSMDIRASNQDNQFYSLFNVVVNLGPDRSQFKPLLTALRKSLSQFDNPQGISSTIPKWILRPVLGYKLNDAHYTSISRFFQNAAALTDSSTVYNPHDNSIDYGDCDMLFRSQLANPMSSSRFSTTFHTLKHIQETVPETVLLENYGSIAPAASSLLDPQTIKNEVSTTMNDNNAQILPQLAPPYLVESTKSLAYLDGTAYSLSSGGKRGYISRNHIYLQQNPEPEGFHGQITVSIPSPLANNTSQITTLSKPQLSGPINSMLSQPIYFPYFFLQLQSQYSNQIPSLSENNPLHTWKKITDAFKYTFQAYLPKLSQDNDLASRPYWNSSQVESIRSALHNGLTLVQGPAGCGKSATLVQITNELIFNNPTQRILILTHSNSGIDELLLRILRDTGIDSRYVLRLGHRHAELSKKLKAEQNQSGRNAASKQLQSQSAEQDGRTDFSSYGRSQYLSNLASQLLSMINYLFSTFPLESRGGSSCIDTCYSAMHFYQKHVIPTWNVYMSTIQDFEIEVQQLKDDTPDLYSKLLDHLTTQFPFLTYFQSTVGRYSSLGIFVTSSAADSIATLTVSAKQLYEYNKQLVLLYFAFVQYLFLSIQELQPLLTIPLGSQRNNFIQGQYARVFGATVAHLISQREHVSNLRLSYDTVLIEEAGQLLDLNTLLSIFSQQQRSTQHYLKRLIMIGDTYQLPPLVQNLDLIRQASFGQSLFSRFLSLGAKFITLDQQGRAHPSISQIWKWIYSEGSTSLQDLPQTHSLAPKINGFVNNSCCWVLRDGSEERIYGTNIRNSVEADYTATLFIYLLLQGYSSSEIAIVVAYREQVALVQDKVKQFCIQYSSAITKINPHYQSQYQIRDSMPRISTVDQFQGQQADIIILSFVRTESVGYLRDLRRLLVAFSRARIGLYALMHQNLLTLCPPLHGFVNRMNPSSFLPIISPTKPTKSIAINNLEEFIDHINSTY